MNKTVLYEEHLKLGAKIGEFAGWSLPVSYTSIVNEHKATREAAGLFDISHMGELKLSGENSSKLLRKLIPTSVDRLFPGKGVYTCFCNDTGGIIDDLFVFMLDQHSFLLVVNAAQIEKDFEWISSHLINDTIIENISNKWSKIDLQGPESFNILSHLFDREILEDIPRFQFKELEYKENKVIVSCTGYTAEHGYEIFIENSYAKDLWERILSVGKSYNLKPVGLGARDTLRLEACYSLYGHELNEYISPYEAGIGWIVNSNDDYLGKDALLMKREHGTLSKIVAFELLEKGIPREQYRIEKDQVDIGFCTSGGFSPTLQKGIGLGLIKSVYAKEGETIDVVIREKRIPAKIVKKPFYTYKERR